MLQDILNRLLVFVVAVDIVALGVLLVFLINFRVNLRRRIAKRRFVLQLLSVVQKSETTEQIARMMNLTADEITLLCKEYSIELPEARIDRIEKARRKKEEEDKRIMDEEAEWRAEQERMDEENKREKDAEMKKRKERLRKFGMS